MWLQSFETVSAAAPARVQRAEPLALCRGASSQRDDPTPIRCSGGRMAVVNSGAHRAPLKFTCSARISSPQLLHDALHSKPSNATLTPNSANCCAG